ncbi:MAG: hypothetical protein PHS59_15160 [Paludibacter sp.]|nr:hypothetical protein [Paludibacter sp.]
MKLNFSKILLIVAFVVAFSSCTTLNTSLREPNVRVELNKSDFVLSGQVSAEATSTTYFGIDFERLFTKKTATVDGAEPIISVAKVPVVGEVLGDRTANYALYEMVSKNAGYDVIFYPSYEKKVVKPILLGIYKITTVKVTGRLGKLK